MSSTTAARAVRDVRHLGDFSVTPRLLVLTLLALPIGAVSAGVSWCLLRLIGLITNAVFYQRVGTDMVAPGAVDHPWWLVLLAPVVGGLVIGVMARYGSEKIRGHGMPETIEAILMNGSRVQPRVAVLKPVSAAVAIGTGGPFGAEGPIIMTGGSIGSLFAQLLRLTADERKTLLVAGATAGMAATFNAPLASIALAVELLLFEWRPRSFVPVAAAVSVAAVVRRPLLGADALFPVPGDLHVTGSTYLLCAVSGVVSAVLAVVATGLVYASEDAFHQLQRLRVHWMWWPAIGGLVIGVGGLFVPQALGVGYDVIGAELDGSIGLGLVVGILVVKTLIWSISLGSGTSGGVLAPVFMIGGALGALMGQVFPDVGPGFWALVGLAGVLGGVMRSPMTGVIFALELTEAYDALLPLVIACTTAFGLSVLLLKRSVLTEKIARRGYHLSRDYDVDPLEVLFVSEVMTEDVLEFREDLDVTSALAALEDAEDDHTAWRQAVYPVVDAAGATTGLVHRGDLFAARSGGRSAARVGDLVAPGLDEPGPDEHGRDDPGPDGPSIVTTHGDQTLRHAAELMAVHGVTTLPVVDRSNPGRVVGIVSLPQLLAGRERDQQEARERERVLRIRLVG